MLQNEKSRAITARKITLGITEKLKQFTILIYEYTHHLNICFIYIFKMEELPPDGNNEATSNIESSGTDMDCKDTTQVL